MRVVFGNRSVNCRQVSGAGPELPHSDPSVLHTRPFFLPIKILLRVGRITTRYAAFLGAPEGSLARLIADMMDADSRNETK